MQTRRHISADAMRRHSGPPGTWKVSMRRFAVPLVIALSSLTLAAQQPELPPPFPRVNATRLLENDRINVWDIVWPKGQPTALHRHVYDQVGTYYARGGRVITTPDGDKRSTMTEVGSLSTTRKGTTHIEEGATDPPLRAVFIELKQPTESGRAPADVGPASLPRDNAKQVLDDDRVTAWDLAWTAGPGSLRYRAPLDTVIVWLGDGTLRVSGTGTSNQSVPVHPGTMRFVARGSNDVLEMADGAPRALIFQLK